MLVGKWSVHVCAFLPQVRDSMKQSMASVQRTVESRILQSLGGNNSSAGVAGVRRVLGVEGLQPRVTELEDRVAPLSTWMEYDLPGVENRMLTLTKDVKTLMIKSEPQRGDVGEVRRRVRGGEIFG